MIHRVYTIFNAEQDGIPPYAPTQHSLFEAVQAGEQILQNSGAQVVHDQADGAFYNRARDRIHLPPKEAFRNAAGYYGTALHELGTGADTPPVSTGPRSLSPTVSGTPTVLGKSCAPSWRVSFCRPNAASPTIPNSTPPMWRPGFKDCSRTSTKSFARHMMLQP